MNSYISHSLEETAAVAKNWLEAITEKYAHSDKALLVGLHGHLGAGKTAFVKLLAKQLGVNEEITSPTFVLMKIYPINHQQWKHLVHIDAYRLEKREELEALRFQELLAASDNLIMLEWPEHVGLDEFEPKTNLTFEAKNAAINTIEHHITIT